MLLADIVSHRLYNHYLAYPAITTPEKLVASFGAVQAQDFAAAKWALGMRLAPNAEAAPEEALPAISAAVIERAFNAGQFLRTHILRPTWHFVAPQDIRWIQALTAPRVNAILASADQRELDIDAGLIKRCCDLITRALQDGRFMTRDELGDVLEREGIEARGRRLGHIIMHAELEALICSGPRRGKQFTYALLEERAPQAPGLAREEALVELARRYFISHGPATMADFAWWSGLTLADTKTALEALSDRLIVDEVRGKTYFRAGGSQPSLEVRAHLLPPYDEYMIAYHDHRPYLDPVLSVPSERSIEATLYAGSVIMDGQVVGKWRRTLDKTQAWVEITSFRALTEREKMAITGAARRYADFLTLEYGIEINRGS